MNRAIAWFVANPVAANLLMGLILVAGITSLASIQQKTMPDIETEMVLNAATVGCCQAPGCRVQIIQPLTGWSLEFITRFSCSAHP